MDIAWCDASSKVHGSILKYESQGFSYRFQTQTDRQRYRGKTEKEGRKDAKRQAACNYKCTATGKAGHIVYFAFCTFWQRDSVLRSSY